MIYVATSVPVDIWAATKIVSSIYLLSWSVKLSGFHKEHGKRPMEAGSLNEDKRRQITILDKGDYVKNNVSRRKWLLPSEKRETQEKA